MTLNRSCLNRLGAAIRGYNFPCVAYDFSNNKQITFQAYSALERHIQIQLLSQQTNVVKDGLSNVLYWGYLTSAGRQTNRVQAFRNDVTALQLNQFIATVNNGVSSLSVLSGIHMPQFSNVSFVSKILMFLDPARFVTLDLQIAKLREADAPSIFCALKRNKTSIPVTLNNEAVYAAWCMLCRLIAVQYFSHTGARAVDVERGVFTLIRDGDAEVAAECLARA